MVSTVVKLVAPATRSCPGLASSAVRTWSTGAQPTRNAATTDKARRRRQPLARGPADPRLNRFMVQNTYAAPALGALSSASFPPTPVALDDSSKAPTTSVDPSEDRARPRVNWSFGPVFDALRYARCAHVAPVRVNR